MKTRLTLFIFCLSFRNIFGQEMSFQMSRDTSDHFRGKVKKVTLYEYQITNFDTKSITSELTADTTKPRYFHHFNEKKQMTKMVVFQEDSIFSTTNYIYDEFDNVIFRLTGKDEKMNREKEILKHPNPKVDIEHNIDSTFQNTYHFLEGEKVPYMLDGFSLKKYAYDTLNRRIFITETGLAPSTIIKLDQKNRMIEMEYYSVYGRNRFDSQKRTLKYLGKNIIEERQETNNDYVLKTFKYDTQNRIIKKATEHSKRPKYNSIIEYDYSNPDSTVAKTFDFEGKLTNTAYEIKNGNRTETISFRPEDNGEPYLKNVVFRDELGNNYKRYRIDLKRGTVGANEKHYIFY